MIFDRYLPSPSWVMPRCTMMPVRGTFANWSVLLGHCMIASATSLPTLFLSMSIAAAISTSRM